MSSVPQESINNLINTIKSLIVESNEQVMRCVTANHVENAIILERVEKALNLIQSSQGSTKKNISKSTEATASSSGTHAGTTTCTTTSSNVGGAHKTSSEDGSNKASSDAPATVFVTNKRIFFINKIKANPSYADKFITNPETKKEMDVINTPSKKRDYLWAIVKADKELLALMEEDYRNEKRAHESNQIHQQELEPNSP